MKNFYLIQVLDLRFQINHINPKKIQRLEEYIGNPHYTRIFNVLIRHREIKTISDRNKLTEIKIIYNYT